MSGIDLLSLPPGAPSPLIGNEEVPVYVNDTVQTTTTQNIANVPGPVYEITAGSSFAAPVGGGTIVVRKTVGSATYITLQPEATGVYYTIKDGKGDAATNNIVINTVAGQIDGLNAYIINWPFGAIDLQFDGAQWNALSNMSSGGGGGVDSFNNRAGNVTLTTADVTGVGGATTAFVNSTVSGYLPLTGGNLSGSLGVTGNLTVSGFAHASTAIAGDDSNTLATTAFVTNAVVASTTGVASWNGRTGAVVFQSSDLTGVGGATTAQLAGYLPLAGGTVTGNLSVSGSLTAPTVASTDNSTNVATTAYVRSAAMGIAANYLPLAGGTLTGNTYLTYAQPYLVLNKTTPTMTNYIVGQNNGVQRWNIALGDGVAESGGNAGSNFEINSYTDGGVFIGAALSINRATGVATFSSNVFGGSYNSSGTNAGLYLNARAGSGDQWCIYTTDGTQLHIWDSSVGDIAYINGTTAQFNGQVMGCAAGNAGQLRMLPNPNPSGIGAMWRNDGSNTYLLFTNNNDAMGQWNGLRPFTVNNGNGAVSVNNGFTANNITTQYGVVYSALAGNTVAFRWTGVLQIFVDGNYNGDIATSGTLGNYLPLSGGTLTGALTVNNGRTTVNAGATINGGCTVSGNGIQYISMANNNMALKWVGNATQIIVDGSYQGTINTSSDARMKSNRAAPQVAPLADILRIKLESFDQTFIPGGKPYHFPVGMIAQQLQQIGADLVDVGVNHDKDGKPTGEERLSVALLPLLSRLVGAVQELSARVDALQAKVV